MSQALSVVTRDPQPYVGTTRTVGMTGVPDVADRIPEILGALAEQGDSPVGAPFLRYLVIGDELTIEAGVPVAEGVTTPAGLHAGVLPAGRYVTTTHVGSFDHLARVTGELLDHAAEQHLDLDHDGDTWACRTESYESDPRVVPMDECVTVVAIRLRQ